MLLGYEDIWRAIPVKRLREILETLPDEHVIYVNPVGNLNVAEEIPPQNGERMFSSQGWIDLSAETYEAL